MSKPISYTDGTTVLSVIVIWDDLHTEARGNWYRAFWAASPDANPGSPLIGYCDSGYDGRWGSYRTIKAAARAARHYYPDQPVYRNGKPV